MAYRSRRRFWRRKLRRRYGIRRRRYFRRAGVVSKFATPGAVTKLSNLTGTESKTETELLTKIIEVNRCIKILYKAWKKKMPRMITLTNYAIATDATYKTNPSFDIIKKMRTVNKIYKLIKIVSSMEQKVNALTEAAGSLDKSMIHIGALAKCRNIGQMMMVHRTLEVAFGNNVATLSAQLNAMITTIVDDVKTVIPYAVPTVQAPVNA